MNWSWLVVIVVSLVPLMAGEKILTLDENRDLLMKTLLKNYYHPSSRPAKLNETLMLFVNIELQHFDYRERDGAFHMVGLLHVRWRDPKLVWDPQNYDNMSHITISQRYIWIPDLEFYNNAPDKFIRMHRNGVVSVKNDGVVFWSDTIDINIFCSTYMKNWPHDKHECHMSLGSWTFDGLEVDIMHINPNAGLSFATTDDKNMEYKVTELNVSHIAKYYSCCQYPYVTMDYNITFERKSAYVVIFRMPAITIIGFTLFGLCLNSNCTGRLWLNSISLWLTTVNLIYFAYNSRHFTRETPNIVTFFSASFILVTLSQLLSIFFINVTRPPFKGRLPVVLDKLLNTQWALWLVPLELKNQPVEECTANFSDAKMDDASNLIDRSYLPNNDWCRLAKLLQRITGFMVSLVFIILSSVCFV